MAAFKFNFGGEAPLPSDTTETAGGAPADILRAQEIRCDPGLVSTRYDIVVAGGFQLHRAIIDESELRSGRMNSRVLQSQLRGPQRGRDEF